MANKESQTIEEQIAILESRGLQVPDKALACAFLHRNNDYCVSGYSLALRNHDVFAPSATFQNIIDIYEVYNMTFYSTEWMQERFHGKTPAEVCAEALVTDTPAQYLIPENKRIQKCKARYVA